MDQITLTKLNKNYESDPNIASPKVEINQEDLVLSFELNYFKFPFKEDQVGKITFRNCYSYRVGDPNDEGFYLGDNEAWNSKNFPSIEWNCFYQASGVPGSYLKNFTVVTQDKNDLPIKLNHYVFFMKEGTFECLAENYTENI